MADITAAIVSGVRVVYDIFVWAKDKWDKIVGGINYIAQLIHYDELKKIHRLAYAISGDYQKLWRGLMKVTRDVSVSLGRDADFLAQVLNSSKNLIYISFDLAGRPLAEAETVWLTKAQDFFQKINWSADYYAAHPESIYTDIDAIFIRGTHHSANAWSARLWKYVNWTTQKAKEHMNQIADLNKSLTDFQLALPAGVRKIFDPVLQKALDALDFTETSVFEEYIATTDKILDIIGKDITFETGRMGDLVDALNRPDEYLQDLTHLGALANSIADSRAAAAASSDLDVDVGNLVTSVEPTFMELQALADALNIEIPPVEWIVPEVEAPAAIPIGDIDPSLTWFVGDF